MCVCVSNSVCVRACVHPGWHTTHNERQIRQMPLSSEMLSFYSQSHTAELRAVISSVITPYRNTTQHCRLQSQLSQAHLCRCAGSHKLFPGLIHSMHQVSEIKFK